MNDEKYIGLDVHQRLCTLATISSMVAQVLVLPC